MFDKTRINNMTGKIDTNSLIKLTLIFIITTTILSTNIQYVNGHICEHRYTRADEVGKFFNYSFKEKI